MSEEIRVGPVTVGGRQITLDPIRNIPVTFNIREVESTIPCGFQGQWGEGEIDGERIELNTGGGFGSRWATIHYRGHDYCFKAEELLSAFLDGLAASEAVRE
jgi:hypothetical protein